MVRLGLKDAGYQYINVDDGYLMSNRSASGRLQPARSFGGPGEAGMRNLSQYIHSLGVPLARDAGALLHCSRLS